VVEAAPPEEVIDYSKPKDQLDLTEEEKDVDIERCLSANNPNAPLNRAEFSYKERCFKITDVIQHTQFHFKFDGWLLEKKTEEGKTQIELEKARAQEIEEKEQAAFERKLLAKDSGEEPPEFEECDFQLDMRIRNQFDFAERASQTFNLTLRERIMSTEPPPSSTVSGFVNQAEMYDSYIRDIERQNYLKEKLEREKLAAKEGKDLKKLEAEKAAPVPEKSEDVVHSAAMSRSLKIAERMVMQNYHDEINMDYKYWNDDADQYKEGEGSLLPLWKFYTDRARRKHVTAMCWNKHYPDMFAAGYGSYDFLKQGSGLICCFTLKNPSHPEYCFSTDSGVMCLDFHPQHPSLIAVGCYDGTVMVFDVRMKVNRPMYFSTIKKRKHTDPVWQVIWQDEDIGKNLNFYSISSDGRVTNWAMIKNELEPTDIMILQVTGQKDRDEEDTSLTGLAGGTCLDFNQFSQHLFILGTEEGKIHKCSKAYNSQYLETYSDHHMSIYAVKWNPFVEHVFISASADWTVKIWDHRCKSSLMSFDLNNAVGDVAWAPFSSTVFVAVTADGKVNVFDLNENKHEPLCDQKAVKKSKLTHVNFNPTEPIICVGDDKGWINCLKLSPNLRKIAPPDKENPKTQNEMEIEKLTKILVSAGKAQAEGGQ
jgi:dynein intermediate chain 1